MKKIKTASPGVHSPTWREQNKTLPTGDEARHPCFPIYYLTNHLNTTEFWDAIHEISLMVFKKYELIGRYFIKHHFIHHGYSWENLAFTLCFPETCRETQTRTITGGLLPTLTHAKTSTNSCGVFFPSLSVISSRGERGRRGDRKLCMRPWTGTETVFQRQILANQLNFTPEYKEYIGLGSLGTNPNLR